MDGDGVSDIGAAAAPNLWGFDQVCSRIFNAGFSVLEIVETQHFCTLYTST